jgi:OmpA-OmpF porin, OOP family
MKIRSLHSPQALRLLALTGLSTLAAASALAQDASYYYGGLSVGQTRAKFDNETIAARQLQGNAPPVGVTGIVTDNGDTAYRLFLGYQVNHNIGFELGFFNLGKYNFRATTNPAGQLNGEMKVQGASLDLVAAFPLSENFSLLARIGAQYAKTRDNFIGTGAVNVTNPSPSQRQLNYKAGGGLQYKFSPNFLMRAEIEQYRVRDAMDGHANVRVISVSAVIPFGEGARSTRSAFVPAIYRPVAYVAPQPVVQAPMPEPVAAAPMMVTPRAVPAPLAVPRRVSFSADALFGFDDAAIRPEGKTALDTFSREMAGTQFDVIVVEGHADRTGTSAYNQTLSLQRADAVKAYLVASGGFDAAKISTAGMGETSPTTQAGDCKPSLQTMALRACLQPDRRVDVDVKGTR